MNTEFELLQDKGDGLFTMDILRNLFESKEGVIWQNLFPVFSIFLNNLL